jgi:cytochrome b561
VDDRAASGSRRAPAVRDASGARYSPVARLLHWLTVVLLIPMTAAGFVLLDLPPGRLQDDAFVLHRSTGVLLFVLTALRLAWRLSHPAPPLPDDVPPLQRRAAAATHLLLYALLLAMPIVGWWATSAYGAPIQVYWLFELPPLVAQDKAVAERAFALHGALGIALVALAALHVGAALYHRFVRHDGVLRRMA